MVFLLAQEEVVHHVQSLSIGDLEIVLIRDDGVIVGFEFTSCFFISLRGTSTQLVGKLSFLNAPSFLKQRVDRLVVAILFKFAAA